MDNKVLRKLFLGFIQIHILHHAKEEAIYGSWMLEELREHGYEISAGTLYPILHNMERDQLLNREDVNVNGKIRSIIELLKGEPMFYKKQGRKHMNFLKKLNNMRVN